MENKNVCAVVVTYNRKDFLLECLESLRKQVYPLQGIYLIDNASVDGTPKVLLESGYIKDLPPQDLNAPWEVESEIKELTNRNTIRFHYVRMHKNRGGAGGFYEGVKRAYKKGYSWLWLMDDDTIACDGALFTLLNKIESLDLGNKKIGFACSKVVWIDGTPHFMNIPSIRQVLNGIPFNYYEERGVLLVETASFVSLLISREVVKEVGLPLKEFFIWADDVEYTLRITRRGFIGLYVAESLVVHKTKVNYSVTQVYDERFFYNNRNWLWVRRLYNGGTIYLLCLAGKLLLFPLLPRRVWWTNIKSCLSSLIRRPKIEYVTDNEM